MSSEPIFLSRDGAIASLILNRPEKRNALSLAMWKAIPELVAQAEADPEVKLLLVRGVDASAFAAGADISEFETIHASRDGTAAYNEAVRAADHAVHGMKKPSIAMIQGPCVGGGCQLAMACDLRYADTSARFGITPANLGLIYGLAATQWLVELVGPSLAKELLFTGHIIDAEEAERIGLATRVFSPERVETETLSVAQRICQVSQYSVRGMKRVIGSILAGSVEHDPEAAALRFESFGGEDNREGVRAFLEKRPPRFTWNG